MTSKDDSNPKSDKVVEARQSDAGAPPKTFTSPKGTEKRATSPAKEGMTLGTLAGALAIAAVIRIVLFEPFAIEGPSMMPTLFDGDRVVVAKFTYGLFLPLMDHALFTWGEPNLGDVVILKSPEKDQVDIVKRVVGLPGDTIEVVHREAVRKNGVVEMLPEEAPPELMPLDPDAALQKVPDAGVADGGVTAAETATPPEPPAPEPEYDEIFYEEIVIRNGVPLFKRIVGPCDPKWAYLDERQTCQSIESTCEISEERVGDHTFHTSANGPAVESAVIKIPPGHVYVLGDHRDMSNDSRRIGPIPIARLRGRALRIYWSRTSNTVCDRVFRWDRIGRPVE